MLLSILAAMLLSLLAFTGQSIASPSTQNETTQSESSEQPPAVVNCFGDPMFNNEGEPIRYNYDKPCPEEKPTALPEANLQSTLEDPVLSALGYDRFADPVVALTGDWPESLTTIRTANGVEFFAAHSTYSDAATARMLSRHRLIDPLDFSKGYTKTNQLTLAGEPDSMMALKLRTNGDPIVVVNTRQRGTGVNAIHGYNLALETQFGFPLPAPYAMAKTTLADGREIAVSLEWRSPDLYTVFANDPIFQTQRSDLLTTAYTRGSGIDLANTADGGVVVCFGQHTNPGVPACSVYRIDTTGAATKVFDLPRETTPNFNWPDTVTAFDFNRDGRQDVVYTLRGNKPDSAVIIWLQNADGTFSRFRAFSAYDLIDGMSSYDVTGDGIEDLIALHGGWQALSWMQNLNGEDLRYYLLEKHALYDTSYDPNGTVEEDFNGDGNVDQAWVSYNYDGIVIMLQRPCVALVQTINETAFKGDTLNLTYSVSNPCDRSQIKLRLHTVLPGAFGDVQFGQPGTLGSGDYGTQVYTSDEFALAPGQTKTFTATAKASQTGTHDTVGRVCSHGVCTPDQISTTRVTMPATPIEVYFPEVRKEAQPSNLVRSELHLNQPVNQRLTVFVEARTVEGDTRVGYGHIVFNANRTSVVFDMAVSNTTDDLWLKIVSTPVGVWPGAVKWQMIDRPQSQPEVTTVQFAQPSITLPEGQAVTSTLVLSTALTETKSIAIAAFEHSGVLLGNRVGYQIVTIPAGVTQLVFTMPVTLNFGDLALQIMSPFPDGIIPGETYRQVVDRPETKPEPGTCPVGGCKVNLPLLMTTGSTRP
jgi:hypothetical protein